MKNPFEGLFKSMLPRRSSPEKKAGIVLEMTNSARRFFKSLAANDGSPSAVENAKKAYAVFHNSISRAIEAGISPEEITDGMKNILASEDAGVVRFLDRPLSDK